MRNKFCGRRGHLGKYPKKGLKEMDKNKLTILVSAILFVGVAAGTVAAQGFGSPRNARSTVSTARPIYSPRITSMRTQPTRRELEWRQPTQEQLIYNRTQQIRQQSGYYERIPNPNDWVQQSNYWYARDRARREVLGNRYTPPPRSERAASIISNIFGALQLADPVIQTSRARRR